MNKSSAMALALACATLSGCGGGGSSTNTPTVNPMAKYDGTYIGVCDGFHQRETITLISTGAAGQTLTSRWDYFNAANCTGSIVASETTTIPASSTYTATVTGAVSGYPVNTATSLTVDQFTITIPAQTLSVTGPGVTRPGTQICIAYTGGSTCFEAANETIGAITATGGYALVGSTLVVVNVASGNMTSDTVYTKQ